MASWFKEYKSSLKIIETEELLDLAIYRPLGFILVKAVKHTDITPNQLTIAALIAGLCSGFAFAQGTPSAFWVGSALYFIFNVLDCSDGQLARLKHNGTPAGRIIDGMADYIAGIAVFIGLGIGYMNNYGNPYLWWLLLTSAVVSNIVHSIVTDNERLKYLRLVYGRRDAFSEELEEYRKELARLKSQSGSPWFDRFVIQSYLYYMELAGWLDKRPEENVSPTTSENHKIVLRQFIKSWTFLGPTTHITIVVVATWFKRPDIAAWIILIPMNLYWLLLYLLQQYKLKHLTQTI
ncbi:MAG: CDP-alcohol phosphatidyltransferase family protein [Bacteroidales bacterium]